MTTDGQAPDMTKEVTNDKMAGNFGDKNANNDSNKNTSQDMTQIWILIGVSVLLLLLGLLVAIKYKEKY